MLARDGAHVVGLDIPPLADDLAKLMAELGGSSIVEDITADDAPKVIVDALEEKHGGVDIVVHNAGVTKDKTLGGMDEDRWSVLMDINLSSEERINDELLGRGLLNDERPHRLRLVDQRHRRQRRSDQLRDLEGRRDRHGPVDGA